jgi:hypothetical protein
MFILAVAPAETCRLSTFDHTGLASGIRNGSRQDMGKVLGERWTGVVETMRFSSCNITNNHQQHVTSLSNSCLLQSTTMDIDRRGQSSHRNATDHQRSASPFFRLLIQGLPSMVRISPSSLPDKSSFLVASVPDQPRANISCVEPDIYAPSRKRVSSPAYVVEGAIGLQLVRYGSVLTNPW